jgi:hypothetical protein
LFFTDNGNFDEQLTFEAFFNKQSTSLSVGAQLDILNWEKVSYVKNR